MYVPRDARDAAHSYFIEISQKALNLGTKTHCGLHRPPWALTTEHILTWSGISYHMTRIYHDVGSRDARATRHIYILQPRQRTFWENFDIRHHLWSKVPLSWVKIGFKCPILPIFLILGFLYPNFECMSPQNAWFWSFFSTILAIIFHRKVPEQKFWMQKKAENLLFQNK